MERMVSTIGGALLGPLAWLIDLQLSYLLIPTVCETGRRSLLLAVGLGAFILALAGATASWRAWRPVREGDAERAEAGWHVRSDEFVRVACVSLCGLSLFLILVLGVPKLLLDPCSV